MIYQLIINVVEIMAVISGAIYVNKYREDNSSRYLFYFLFFTLFIELIFGWLPRVIGRMEILRFLENSILSNNEWIYNIYIITKFLFYTFYFNLFLKKRELRNIMIFGMFLFLISTVINLIFSKVFFVTISSYTYITGSLLLMLSVLFYFFEVLKSDEILNFHKTIVFYISIGTLIFHLCVTPLFIYSKYYKIEKSPEFVQVYQIILTAANIFMYSCYTIGFLVCSRKNKSY